jgi:hypothetical protein
MSIISAIRTRLRRALPLAALALVAGTAMVGVQATPAAATTTNQVIRIAPFSNPLLTLDVSGASFLAGAPVIQWTLNTGPNQMWQILPHGGYFWIVNVRSGLCLADGGAGHPVVQWPCGDPASGTMWDTYLTASTTLGYPIMNVQSHLYLDVNQGSLAAGAGLTTWTWNGGFNQYFLGTLV